VFTFLQDAAGQLGYTLLHVNTSQRFLNCPESKDDLSPPQGSLPIP